MPCSAVLPLALDLSGFWNCPALQEHHREVEALLSHYVLLFQASVLFLVFFKENTESTSLIDLNDLKYCYCCLGCLVYNINGLP